MSAVLGVGDEQWMRRAEVRVPTIAIAIIVSLLLHVLVLVWAPHINNQQDDPPVPPPMQAYLRPAPSAPAPPSPRVKPALQVAPKAAPPPPPQAAKPPATPPPTRDKEPDDE